jgi:hypothetical protein
MCQANATRDHDSQLLRVEPAATGCSTMQRLSRVLLSVAEKKRYAQKKRTAHPIGSRSCASSSYCFQTNKEARGTSPAPLQCYLFLAVLRRAVPVFFAVDFLAAAVLRAGFFFVAVFLFATAMMHPSFGLAGC